MRLLAALLIASAFAAQPLRAELRVTRVFEEISERGKVPRLIVTAEQGSFSLIIPSTWALTRLDAERQRVQFSLSRLQAALHLALHGGRKDLSPAALSRQLLLDYPGARIVDQAKCYAAGTEGVQLEIEFTAASGELYRTRLGYLKIGEQTIEVSLAAPSQYFEKIHSGWTSVLNSLRSEKAAGAEG